jgi:hypothetical protein
MACGHHGPGAAREAVTAAATDLFRRGHDARALAVTEGGLVIETEVEKRLDAVVDELASSVRRLQLAAA